MEAPLGWSLSGGSREDMRKQMSTDANQCSLMALRYWLTADAGDGSCVAGTVVSQKNGLAVAGRDVCISGESETVSTNAYGVFVRVYRGAQLPSTDNVVCANSGLTRDGDGHGPDGQIKVAVPFVASDQTVQSAGAFAGWWAFGTGAAALVVVVGWILVCRHVYRTAK
jgi:hypothetical protein